MSQITYPSIRHTHVHVSNVSHHRARRSGIWILRRQVFRSFNHTVTPFTNIDGTTRCDQLFQIFNSVPFMAVLLDPECLKGKDGDVETHS